MKKKKTLLLLSMVFLATAILLISYSLFLIIGSQMREKERMNEWDQLFAKETNNSQQPVSSMAETSSHVSSGNSFDPTPTGTVYPKNVYKPELFGLITFPSLKNRKVVIVNGISDRDLRGAAGHAKNSVLPGEIGNCVVFGHRDGVFRGFKDLKTGDLIIFKTLRKEVKYKIISMSVEKPKAELISRKYYDRSILTLITCYPFNYVGAAPNRYVVVSELAE
ncbi:MAG: class D sortase [Saccharofermentanales bacterium]